jgi:hypothetical protein
LVCSSSSTLIQYLFLIRSSHVDVRGGKGPADALFIDNVPIPEPLKGQVIVKIKAFGLNRMDLLQREGRYPVPPQAPKTMGVEFSGTIDSLDDTVKDFKVGDDVFGLAYGGTSLARSVMLRVKSLNPYQVLTRNTYPFRLKCSYTSLLSSPGRRQLGYRRQGDSPLLYISYADKAGDRHG